MTAPGAASVGSPGRKISRAKWRVSFKRYSVLYALAVVVLVFAIWTPHTFLTLTTFRTLLDEQAITAIMAVGLTIPLAAAAYDLSIGYILGLSTVMAAWLMVTAHLGVVLSIVVATTLGAVVGLANGLVVTRLHVDAFITTLGMGSIAFAITEWISNNQVLIGMPEGFSTFANGQLFGIQYVVFYMVGIALLVWYLLTYTPWGRYTYAVGGNRDAARLSGIPVRAVTVFSLVAGALIAGFAGVCLSSQTAAGSPSVGADYLLPAYAAVFLGSTQFSRGLVNVWGSVVSVYLLATGVKGLELVGAPFWIPDLFNGAALIVAVAVSRDIRIRMLTRRFRRARPQRDLGSSGESADATSSPVGSIAEVPQ